MNRIHNFSSFSSLYEAEEVAQKPYLKFIQQIVAQLFTAYNSQVRLTEDPYDAKIMGDLDSVAAAPGAESLKKILANVRSAVDGADPAAKTAGRAWTASGEKFVSALEKVLVKLKDNKESLDAANKTIKDFVETQKKNLPEAAKNNDVKDKITGLLSKLKDGLDHSDMLSYSDLNEGVLKDVIRGKKGKIKDLISGQITLIKATLATVGEIPGMADTVKKLQSQVDGVASRMAELLTKKDREIDEAEITKAADELSAIPTELAKASKDLDPEILKDYKEAAQDYIDGLKTLEATQDADQAYAEKAKDDVEEEKAWNDSAKSTIGFKGTVKMDDVKGKKNTVVAGFQKQVIDKFKSILKDSEVFKKFSEGKFAGDGYFGDNTAKVVQGIKAGFGMDDKTSDITDEFLDKVYSYAAEQKQNESQSFGRIQTFSSFESLNEAKLKFDVKKFLEVADGEKSEKKDLPSLKGTLEKMKKVTEENYEAHREAVDYILSKEFSPSEKGKDAFKNYFSNLSYDQFGKLTDENKKTAASRAMGLLASATGTKKIEKNLVDLWFKEA